MGHAPVITRSKDDLPLPEGPIILLTTVCEDTITRNTNATGHAQQVLSLVHLLAKPEYQNGYVSALTTVLFWARAFRFLRVFKNMSALLEMVEAIIWDTKESMVLLSPLTCAAAHASVSK